MSEQVLVVIGVGGMGEAVARRLGAGRTVVLGDVSEQTLRRVAASLGDDGFQVITQQVDVTARDSVRQFVDAAAKAGRITQVVHTAGLSPVQASTEKVLRVDLYGVAAILEEFGAAVAPGGAGVIIASMAAHLSGGLSPEQERALMKTPAEELLRLPFLQPSHVSDSGHAYAIAKRANVLRVLEASVAWGRRRARINSISPGIISTAMGQEELKGPDGQKMRAMLSVSPMGRLGSSSDIAAAAAFLLGPDASFVTGTDLLVDGGVVAALKTGRLEG
ncbi:MAG: SDR family oxidoreductase [Cystobacter sp.]